MKYLLPAVLVFFFLSGCSNKESEEKIVGNWSVFNWEIVDSGEKLRGQMSFAFNDEGLYSLDYGTKKENGKFWIIGDVLHTQAEGESEIIVKLTRLDSDTMEFEMNRGGTIEKVEFVRQ